MFFEKIYHGYSIKLHTNAHLSLQKTFYFFAEIEKLSLLYVENSFI